jgi:hypothetical protein
MTPILFATYLLMTLGAATEDGYVATPIDSSPGLYYERLHNIRFKRAEWRLILFVDVEKMEQEFPEASRNYSEIYNECKTIRTIEHQCDALLQRDYLNSRILEAEELREELKDLANEISLPDIDNLPRSIVRRGVPFGFVGSTSHYLFGTLTTEDADYFNSEIDKLYKDQNKLTRILKNQTHLISSKLHALHDLTQQHQATLDQNRQKINETITAVNKLSTRTDLLNYTSAVWRYSLNMGKALDHYITSVERFITAIHSARDGKIHGSLLTGSQLRTIIKEIHESVGEYELPVPRSYHRNEEIAKIATTEVGRHEGKIMVTLRLPLVERTTYHLYQMHAWPIPQKNGNDTISVSIIPRTPYFGLSDDHRTYFLPDDKYVREYTTTDGGCYIYSLRSSTATKARRTNIATM